MKRLFVKMVLLAMLLCLTLPAMVMANEQERQSDDELCIELFNEINEMFIAEFGHEFVRNHNRSVDNAITLGETFPRDKEENVVYPDYYGGRYIDNDGNLVVLMVESTAALRSMSMGTRAVLDCFDGVKIRPVAFSYNELLDLWRYLGVFTVQYRDNIAMNNASSWYVDVIDNKVVVNLTDFSRENIDLFKKMVVDSPMIDFQESKGEYFYLDHLYNEPTILTQNENKINSSTMSSNVITVTTGQRIWINNSHTMFGQSIGYRAFNVNGRLGFVTSAHGPPNEFYNSILDWRVWHGSTVSVMHGGVLRKIGTVRQSRLYSVNYPPMAVPFRFDASFVEIDPEPNFTVNLVSANHGLLVRNAEVGETIVMRGTDGNDLTRTLHRIVSSINATYRWHDAIVDVTSSSQVSGVDLVPGMSGGIIWFARDVRVAGIIMAADGSFCRAFVINQPIPGFNLTT
jgi:hypothetical protein